MLYLIFTESREEICLHSDKYLFRIQELHQNDHYESRERLADLHKTTLYFVRVSTCYMYSEKEILKQIQFIMT